MEAIECYQRKPPDIIITGIIVRKEIDVDGDFVF
jgi:hypothetical protein